MYAASGRAGRSEKWSPLTLRRPERRASQANRPLEESAHRETVIGTYVDNPGRVSADTFRKRGNSLLAEYPGQTDAIVA